METNTNEITTLKQKIIKSIPTLNPIKNTYQAKAKIAKPIFDTCS